jgi:hypothetical protein
VRDHRYETHDPFDTACPRNDPFYSRHCPICDGGLSCCIDCGGLEGGLPSECPGVQMSYDRGQAVYRGQVDFVDGRWQSGKISKYSPEFYAHLRKENQPDQDPDEARSEAETLSFEARGVNGYEL